MGYLLRKRTSIPARYGAHRRIAGVSAGGRASGMTAAGRQSMGDIWSDLTAAINVLDDPYANEVVCHIQQLGQIKAGTAVQGCVEVPSGVPGGIGLDNVAIGLRYYVYAEQNPWVYPLAAIGIIGLPFLLGYYLGEG
jgi:hypothetical protein